MTKLLSANFRRLFRAPIVWFGLVASCVYTLFGVINNFYYKGVMPGDSSFIRPHTAATWGAAKEVPLLAV